MLNDYFDGEKVIQAEAGKFHSLFLTGKDPIFFISIESGRVFACGYNKYGQVGVSNSLFVHVEEPVEVYTDGMKIKEISAGWHHNLLLSEEGKLYGFGARMNG